MHRRPTRTAAFAVVLFVVGQLVAFEHESESRHVTCSEHGEQIDAADLGATRDDGCGQSHFVGVDGEGGDHKDCAIARLLRTSTNTSDAPTTHVTTTTIEMVELPAPIANTRSVAVILIAPKTSPPRLS